MIRIGPNGSNAVVCRETNGLLTAELLDFHEMRIGTGHEVVEIPSLALEDQAKWILDRFERILPPGALNREWFDEHLPILLDEIQFMNRLASAPEQHGAKIDPDCKKAPIAVRFDHTSKRDKHFTIDRKLWLILPESHKVGLVIHELIDWYAVENLRVKGSPNSRSMTRLLFSKHLTHMTWEDIAARSARLGFCEFDQGEASCFGIR